MERVKYTIRLRVQNKERAEEDRDWDTAERENTTGEELLRGIQEPEYRTVRIRSSS
jgi:hypothetical protein